MDLSEEERKVADSGIRTTVPHNYYFLARYQRAANALLQRVADALGLPPLPGVVVRYGNTQGYAATSGAITHPDGSGVITLNPNLPKRWEFADTGSMMGLMAHELTHATIGAAGGFEYGEEHTIPWAFQEGMADWVKKEVVGPTLTSFPPGYVEGIIEKHPRPIHTGYQDMAGFLRWQNKRVPGSVPAIAQQLAANTFSPQSFQGVTGRPIHTAVHDYRFAKTQEVNAYNPVHQRI